MHTKKQRAAACIVWAAFLLVTLCSVLYIVKEAEHDCTGADCPICAQMVRAENALENLGNGDPAVNTGLVLPGIGCFLALAFGICAVPYITPVAQKVRMND